MTVAYQDSQWLFAGMELGRRLLLLILIITFPLNRVNYCMVLLSLCNYVLRIQPPMKVYASETNIYFE